jgi:acyl-CoA thioester hydrolase
MMHSCNFRVYYEDTDAGGVVYYANYLKFAERARTELLRSFALNQVELAAKHNMLFVVRNAALELLKPARLDDLLTIETEVLGFKAAAIELEQNIYLEKIKLCNIKIKLVLINKDFRPVRLPDFLKKVFSKV